jgi:hypothetical protein
VWCMVFVFGGLVLYLGWSFFGLGGFGVFFFFFFYIYIYILTSAPHGSLTFLHSLPAFAVIFYLFEPIFLTYFV